MNILSVKDLSFGYEKDKKVLKNISFDIEQGKYVSLIGHNGSGKSTLAKLIVGLLDLQSGSIEVFGEVMKGKNIYNLRQKIGIVFQNPDNQFIGATVRDDIAFGLENNCVPHNQMDEIINEFAGKVNMMEFLDKEPTRLSGGQKQRVAIAGVLAMSPKIIIFDEATAMLDPKGKKEIREYILKMKKEDESLTIISITHDIEEAYNSDEVIILNDGELYLKGNPKEIFKNETKLKEIELDLPFLSKLKDSLIKRNIDVENVKTMEELVNALCQ
ncbi:MAG: energy-coupling factor transporter ATPase [Erysipelotrichales bacterium]|nr:energy-coupling factor transporter ATPase [Erysipelotrichales bacterium]